MQATRYETSGLPAPKQLRCLLRGHCAQIGCLSSEGSFCYLFLPLLLFAGSLEFRVAPCLHAQLMLDRSNQLTQLQHPPVTVTILMSEPFLHKPYIPSPKPVSRHPRFAAPETLKDEPLVLLLVGRKGAESVVQSVAPGAKRTCRRRRQIRPPAGPKNTCVNDSLTNRRFKLSSGLRSFRLFQCVFVPLLALVSHLLRPSEIHRCPRSYRLSWSSRPRRPRRSDPQTTGAQAARGVWLGDPKPTGLLGRDGR